MINKEEIIKWLKSESLNAGGSERLMVNGEQNDSYKVCYRLLANMLGGCWQDRFDSFPTEDDAIEMAKKVDPYFVELFKDEEDGLDQFKRLYEFHEDVWN